MPAFPAPISRRTVLGAGGVIAASAALGLGVPGTARAAAPAGLPWQVGLTTEQQAGQRAGQRVVFSCPGGTSPDDLLQWIREGKVGGLIFFGENILSLQQITDVITQLRQAPPRTRCGDVGSEHRPGPGGAGPAGGRDPGRGRVRLHRDRSPPGSSW